jgi:hypothetical protein
VVTVSWNELDLREDILAIFEEAQSLGEMPKIQMPWPRYFPHSVPPQKRRENARKRQARFTSPNAAWLRDSREKRKREVEAWSVQKVVERKSAKVL